jgi:hypothetical protein
MQVFKCFGMHSLFDPATLGLVYGFLDANNKAYFRRVDVIGKRIQRRGWRA